MRRSLIRLAAAAFTIVLAEACIAQTGHKNLIDQSSTEDYRARTVYFLVTDRFHAHEPYSPYVDPRYPSATNTVNCFVDSCSEEEQFRKYWGGDIQGIVEKLDYLRDLGASALWVTPLMENVRAYVGGTGYGTGYHGYWVQDYYQVNKHFGVWPDVEQLSDSLHARGARYIQDITLNHSNPNDNHVFGRLFQDGNVFIKNYDDDRDTATGERSYKHYQDDQRCIDAATKPDYDWTFWQLHHCPLADLSGYNQRNYRVADYLLGAGKTWLDHGVDDFRLDAVKYPFPEFIANYTRSMRQHATDQQRSAPYFFGEWSHGGVGDAKSLLFANSYDFFGVNILDFSLSLGLNRFIGGSHEYITEQITATDLDHLLHERVKAFQGRDTWEGTFIDNHDQIRTMVRLQKIGISDEAERRQRMDLATVLLMTVRGIPIIYYGDEQYLAHYDDMQDTDPQYVNSGNDDPWNRPGMTNWDESTPAFRIIRTLAKLRKRNPAIWKGAYKTVYAQGDVLVFERVEGDNVVLVAVNRGDDVVVEQHGRLNLQTGIYRGLIADASNANRENALTVSGSGWRLSLNKLSSIVVERRKR
jgi:cyclomaltodextrin glucanotransferase